MARPRSAICSRTAGGPFGSKGLSMLTFQGFASAPLSARRSPPRLTSTRFAPAASRRSATRSAPSPCRPRPSRSRPRRRPTRSTPRIDPQRQLLAGGPGRHPGRRRAAARGLDLLEAAVIAGRDHLVEQGRVEQAPVRRQHRGGDDRLHHGLAEGEVVAHPDRVEPGRLGLRAHRQQVAEAAAEVLHGHHQPDPRGPGARFGRAHEQAKMRTRASATDAARSSALRRPPERYHSGT